MLRNACDARELADRLRNQPKLHSSDMQHCLHAFFGVFLGVTFCVHVAGRALQCQTRTWHGS